MANNWLITSYFTLNTYYEQVAREYLIKSLLNLDIPYFIEGVPSLGDWNKNTHYKATFIMKMLETFPNRDIVFTDSDSIIHSYPTLFDTLTSDLAYYTLIRQPQGRKEVLTGTMYIRNNPTTYQLVKTWVRNLETDKKWEQIVLQKLLEKEGNGLSIYPLPPEYCKIFDYHQIKTSVIEHYQKSRIFRKKGSLSPLTL